MNLPAISYSSSRHLSPDYPTRALGHGVLAAFAATLVALVGEATFKAFTDTPNLEEVI